MNELELKDWTALNIANTNFANPYRVVDLDVTNHDAVKTGAILPSGAGSTAIGVLYDKSKLDPSGAVVTNSAVTVRTWGIARVEANAAITAGDFVSVAASTGRVKTQTQASGIVSYAATLTPAAAVANTTAEQTFTFTGVAVGDVALGVQKPTAQAGLGIVGVRVAGANSVGITFSNNTGSNITPTASESYVVTVLRGATAGTTSQPVPIIGRALTDASAQGDRILVLLHLGGRF